MQSSRPPVNPLYVQFTAPPLPQLPAASTNAPSSSPIPALPSQPNDVTIELHASLSAPACNLIGRPAQDRYIAHYPMMSNFPFAVTVRAAARQALEKAGKDGARSVVFDLTEAKTQGAIPQVIRAIEDYVARMGPDSPEGCLMDIAVRSHQSAVSIWDHRFQKPYDWPRIRPISVDATKGEGIPDFNVDDPPDVTVIFQNQRYPEKQEIVHLVSTGKLFRSLVTWKMGFSIYYQQDNLFIYLTKWQHPERYSPHDIISQGRAMLIDRFGEQTRGLFFEKGYIAKSDREKSYLISDLGGSPYHRDRGVQEPSAIPGRLTEKARILQAIFASRFGIDIGFEDPHKAELRSSRSYGPR